MITKTVKYVDFNGNIREETFYFNLSQAEAMELELSKDGGLAALCQRLVAAQDLPQMIALWKEILLLSYGEKSPTGREFIKNAELTEKFKSSPAYSEIFIELSTDQEKAIAFINALSPKSAKVE